MREITVSGHLAADPEMKSGNNGQWWKFRIGNNEYGDEKDANGKSITSWYSVLSFVNKPILAKMKKGSFVKVSGDYSDKIYVGQNGQSYIDRTIIAYDIKFMEGSRSADATSTDSAREVSRPPETKITTSAAMPQPASSGMQFMPPTKEGFDDLPF